MSATYRKIKCPEPEDGYYWKLYGSDGTTYECADVAKLLKIMMQEPQHSFTLDRLEYR